MPSADIKPRTLYDKVFQDHVVHERDDGTVLLYIGMAGRVRTAGVPH
jgi:3-isopropylmalate dehydratase